MKLTYDEVLERLAEQRQVNAKDVDGRALKRAVWIAGWGLPGCLLETIDYCETARDAIDTAVGYAGDDTPRGIRKALKQFGRFQHKTDMYGTVVTEVWKTTLASVLGNV